MLEQYLEVQSHQSLPTEVLNIPWSPVEVHEGSLNTKKPLHCIISLIQFIPPH